MPCLELGLDNGELVAAGRCGYQLRTVAVYPNHIPVRR